MRFSLSATLATSLRVLFFGCAVYSLPVPQKPDGTSAEGQAPENPTLRPILNTCREFILKDTHWLSALCDVETPGLPPIRSKIDLDRHLTNESGRLTLHNSYQTKGFYTGSCRNCALDNVVLVCECDPGKKEGETEEPHWVRASFDLSKLFCEGL